MALHIVIGIGAGRISSSYRTVRDGPRRTRGHPQRNNRGRGPNGCGRCV